MARQCGAQDFRRVGKEMKARCIFHDDDDPSLSIDPERQVWKCFPCDKGGDVLDLIGHSLYNGAYSRHDKEQFKAVIARAAELAGIQPQEYGTLIIDPPHASRSLRVVKAEDMPTASSRIEATYDYIDADGQLRYQVVRERLPNGDKDIKQRRPDGKGGWIYKVKGLEPLLYNLPAILEAPLYETVWIVEGEKCADALIARGLLATTNHGGAGKWRPEISAPLVGRSVAILADHDEPGLKHVDDVGRQLYGKVRGIRQVPLPGLADGEDVYDWLQAGHTVIELEALYRNADIWEPPPAAPQEGDPVLTWFSDIKPEEVRWLWDRRIPYGKLTLMVGDPGDGKSYLSLALATAVSRGAALPFTSSSGNPGRVIVANYEDGAGDTIRPRLDRMGADVGRIAHLEGVIDKTGTHRPFHSSDITRLESQIRAIPDLRMLIVDPIASLVGGQIDMAKDNQMRAAATGPLAALAERTGIAVIGILHLNKSQAVKAIYRVSGTLGGIIGPARSVLLVAEDPESKRRALVSIKCNIGVKPEPLEFVICDRGVEWVGEAPDLGADRLLGPPPAPERTAAMEFLKAELASGPRLSSDIDKAAGEADISIVTLKRAKKEARIHRAKEKRADSHWWIALPEHKTELEEVIRSVSG